MIKNAIGNFLRLLTRQPAIVKETTLDGTQRIRLASMRSRRDCGSTDILVKGLTFGAKLADPLRSQRETYGKMKAYLFSNDRSFTASDAVKNHALTSCCESLNISPESDNTQTK